MYTLAMMALGIMIIALNSWVSIRRVWAALPNDDDSYDMEARSRTHGRRKAQKCRPAAVDELFTIAIRKKQCVNIQLLPSAFVTDRVLRVYAPGSQVQAPIVDLTGSTAG